MNGFKNIMVALEINPPETKVLEYAKVLGQKFSAKIWLVHVAAKAPDFVDYEPGAKYLRNFKAHELGEEHKRLQSWSHQLKTENIDSEALLIQGATVESVLSEAKKLQCDLVMVGKRDKGFLAGLFSENTSENLLKQSELPMFTVPLPDKEATEE